MISRWLISFSFVAVLLPGAEPELSVTGFVTLRDSREPAVKSGRDYSGVVVWLEPAGSMSYRYRTQTHAVIQQKDKRFSPHILAVQTGTTVDFPNLDPIFHNAFSNFDGKVFDIGLYPPRTSRSVTFQRAGFVRVFCNIHPTMSAVIAVLPTPWFALSRADGSYVISAVPPGEYTLRVAHERATPQTLLALTRKIIVSEGMGPVPPLTISESGYLPVPHKNKYGKEYPPTVEDSLYPGARK